MFAVFQSLANGVLMVSAVFESRIGWMESGPGDLLGLIFDIAFYTSLSVIMKFESCELSCRSVRTRSWAS